MQAHVLLEVCAVMQLHVLYMYVKLYLSSLRLMRWKSHAAELWTLTAPYSPAAPSASRRKCAMEEVVISRSPCKSYIAEVCYTPTPCSKYEGPCMKPSESRVPTPKPVNPPSSSLFRNIAKLASFEFEALTVRQFYGWQLQTFIWNECQFI